MTASDDDIHCHDGQNVHGLRVFWRPESGDHHYRGSGTSLAGESQVVWSPCSVCREERGHQSHGSPWRTCGYCGSIHPADLLALPEPTPMRTIDLGGTKIDIPNLSWADWKYGYPHKLYIEFGAGLESKFYSRHLRDHPDLIPAFNERFGFLGVIFGNDDGGLWWRRSIDAT